MIICCRIHDLSIFRNRRFIANLVASSHDYLIDMVTDSVVGTCTAGSEVLQLEIARLLSYRFAFVGA